ncbi:MAG: putative rane protein [Roseomonas sp.]|nr:putative rane protein [Roseomonas sp.]
MRAVRGAFFGWHVVGAAFVIAVFAWGIGFYGPPIFLTVLHDTRGWPVPLVSAAITAHFLLGAVAVANLAALHRRFGVATTTRAGALLTALGLLGWAFAHEPWQLFLATPVSGAGWALTSGAALNAMVSPWFIRRRAAALSMAFNGASMGGVLFSPLWAALIGRAGFAWAAVLVAAALVLVVWFLAGRYLGRSPAAMGLAPDGGPQSGRHPPVPHRAAAHAAPLPRPWRDRRFVTLAIASMLGLFAQVGLVAHLFSLLVPVLGEAGSGLTIGAATACAIAGRSLLARLMPPAADRRLVAAANVALQAVGSGVLLWAGPSVPLVLLGCGLFGLGLGNVTSLPPLIAQSEFNAPDVSRVVALVTAVSQAGYAFAPAAFGLLREPGIVPGTASSPGHAPLLFAAAAAIQLAAAAVVLLGRRAVPQGKAVPAG